jgi:hypothetical protein
VRAHLAGQPVSAQPDRWSYRAGKFVHRHLAGISVAAAAAVALIVFGAIVAAQSARTARERARAERVSAFVTDLLRSPDPLRGRGGAITVREVLDSAVVRIDTELRDEPTVRADLLGVIGRSYDGLGLYGEASRVLGTAVALRKRMHESGQALADDEAELAADLHESGADTNGSGESVAEEAIRTARQRLRPDDPALARILTLTAHVIDESGHPARAESLMVESIAILQRRLPPDRLALSDAIRMLGRHRWARLELASAETLYAQALALRRDTLGAGHPDVGDLEARLGDVLAQEGKPEAERYLREGIAIKQRALGADHPAALENLYDLAHFLAKRGEYAQAESLLTLEVNGSRRAGPDAEQLTAEALGGLASVALMKGDTSRGLAGLKEERRIYERITPPDDAYRYGGVLDEIAEVYIAQRRFADAEPLLLRTLDSARRQFGDTNPRTRGCAKRLAELYERWGKPDNAREYRRLADSTAAPR